MAIHTSPLNIHPVVVVRGLKRQQAAALTNFVGCFLLALSYFFFLLFLTALNDLTGPPYSIPYTHEHIVKERKKKKKKKTVDTANVVCIFFFLENVTIEMKKYQHKLKKKKLVD